MAVGFNYDDIGAAEKYIHDNVVEGVNRFPGRD
jgi:hypothetical protein